MSSLSVEQIVQGMLAKLKVTAPGLSMEVGTPERKILEAAAEAIFESQVDDHLVSTQLDIDLKSGTDLDDFVGVFGFGRLQGEYATGLITLTLDSSATQPVVIPVGTQFFKSGDLNNITITYATTQQGVIPLASKTVILPVQATIRGVIANAPAGTIKGFPAGIGIGSCTNIDPLSGGADDESDDELRARFKNTFLRNISGTEDFYRGMALQAKGVSRVNVLGPVSTYYAQVQTGAVSTPVTLSAKNCQYVYPEGGAVSENRGSSSQVWYTETVDYNMTSGVLSAPVITPLSTTANKFLDISYEYLSSNSRNNPLFNLMNKIDIYVDGSAPVQVTENFQTWSYPGSPDWTNVYYTGNFKQVPSTDPAITTSTVIQRLGSTPILLWPTTIQVLFTSPGPPAWVTYTLGTHYRRVRGITANQASEREVAGIAWITTPPTNGLAARCTYTYNQIPEVLNSIFKKSKQVTSDPLVHAAYSKILGMSFVIQYTKGSIVSDVDARITTALSNYLSSLAFGSWIQLSDLATFVHNVKGVDNCRMATLADSAPYTIKEIENGTPIGSNITADFQLGDNEIPVLGPVNIIRRSYNTFA